MGNFYHVDISNLGVEKIQKAKKFAEKVVSETYDRFSYEYKRRVETIYIGKIAEEVFKIFAEKELNVILEVNYDIYEGTENVDENDFFINDLEIDIKSSKDTQNKGIDNCFNYFNFPVPTDQSIKDITISILYDYNIQNFYIVSWIDREKYSKNATIKKLHVGNGIYKEYYLYKLKDGYDIKSLIEKLKD